MTPKVLEIDVMVYNMTKNPKIYKKNFLVTVFENDGFENQQISKITNVEKHRNFFSSSGIGMGRVKNNAKHFSSK